MHVYNYVFMTMLPWVGSRQASQNKPFWFPVCVISCVRSGDKMCQFRRTKVLFYVRCFTIINQSQRAIYFIYYN